MQKLFDKIHQNFQKYNSYLLSILKSREEKNQLMKVSYAVRKKIYMTDSKFNIHWNHIDTPFGVVYIKRNGPIGR